MSETADREKWKLSQQKWTNERLRRLEKSVNKLHTKMDNMLDFMVFHGLSKNQPTGLIARTEELEEISVESLALPFNADDMDWEEMEEADDLGGNDE